MGIRAKIENGLAELAVQDDGMSTAEYGTDIILLASENRLVSGP